MKITNKLAYKLIKEIETKEVIDRLFTEALTSLEVYDYITALELSEIIIKESGNIEQRCGALMMKHVASFKNKEITDGFLNTIYKNL